jgi:hypothetical protein
VDHRLPGADIVVVMAARELRDPEPVVVVAHARHRPCATERSARCDQHPKPAPVVGVVLDALALELQARVLELAERGPGRRRELVVVVEVALVHAET